MAKFSKAKINDKVWSVQYGWGMIHEWVQIDNHYKGFQVKFNNGDYEVYFEDGRVNISDPYPTLFWNEFHILSDDEDIKPFDLVGFLKENFVRKEFEPWGFNFYLYYDHLNETFSISRDSSYEKCDVYFKFNSQKFKQNLTRKDKNNIIYELNQNKITIQQLKEAYKELGWL